MLFIAIILPICSFKIEKPETRGNSDDIKLKKEIVDTISLYTSDLTCIETKHKSKNSFNPERNLVIKFEHANIKKKDHPYISDAGLIKYEICSALNRIPFPSSKSIRLALLIWF